MPRNPSLSTTSYAILGQLEWGEATTYELVKAMRRNLRWFWPRAESRIYEECKRLVGEGLANARPGRTGRRRHTTYTIAPAGRAALKAWLAEAPGSIVLEHEPLLRVFLGRPGRVEDLMAAVEAVREHAEEMLAVGGPLAEEYLEGSHPQQREVHLRALTFDYLWRWAQLNRDWAERAQREISRWDDVSPQTAKDKRALARLRELTRAA